MSLHTRDYDEACKLARDRVTLAEAGNPITTHRKAATTPKDTFAAFARLAFADLEENAAAVDAVHPDRGALANAIIVQVKKKHGKHHRARLVVVFEGRLFPIRRLLTDLSVYRRKQGA